MATAGKPITTGRAEAEPRERPEAYIVELSDDEPTVVLPNAPKPAAKTFEATPVVVLSKSESSHDGNDTDPNDDDDDEDDDDDDGQDDKGDLGETFSDSDSLINDLMHAADEDDSDQELYAGEICTYEEAMDFRRRLHLLGPDRFVSETIEAGAITAKKLLTAFGVLPPMCFEGSPDERYYRMLGMAMMEELMKRRKLPQYNNIEDVVKLLQASNNIIVITGAGISTNLGIPDFRSKDTGFYAKMQAKGFGSGEEVFDIELFNDDPRHFYENCSDTFPVAGVTSPTHAFIGLLQNKGKLLTNYTQNIDNIEASAGIDNDKLIQCHGSWATATCRKCGFKVPGQDILQEVKAGDVPKCRKCIEEMKVSGGNEGLKRKRASGSSGRSSKSRKRGYDDDDSSSDEGQYDIPEPGIMKPDITFFGEALPSTFFDRFNGRDKQIVDLVLVIGTSMKVAPVSEIPMAVPSHVPHIYISRDPCSHIGFDVTFLGDCDVIVAELARQAGWALTHKMLPENQETYITLTDEEKAVWSVSRIMKG